MESKTSRQLALLAVLLAALAGVLWWNLRPPPAPHEARQAQAARPAPGASPGAEPVEEIRLEALSARRPEPTAGGRDPFRFRAPAPRRVDDGGEPELRPGTSAGADGAIAPTGPPPIPLRFIGVVRLPEGGQLVAVLSDGNGVYRGSEGDIIEGRYRIVRLRPEAVELAHVDGRGHQVIRLSGS